MTVHHYQLYIIDCSTQLADLPTSSVQSTISSEEHSLSLPTKRYKQTDKHVLSLSSTIQVNLYPYTPTDRKNFSNQLYHFRYEKYIFLFAILLNYYHYRKCTCVFFFVKMIRDKISVLCYRLEKV